MYIGNQKRKNMRIGFIGLGKMGFNMVHRLLNDQHEVVVWNRSTESVDEISKLGATAARSVKELTEKLQGRKVVWLMVPAGKPVDENLEMLMPLLSPGISLSTEEIHTGGIHRPGPEGWPHMASITLTAVHRVGYGGLKTGIVLCTAGIRKLPNTLGLYSGHWLLRTGMFIAALPAPGIW